MDTQLNCAHFMLIQITEEKLIVAPLSCLLKSLFSSSICTSVLLPCCSWFSMPCKLWWGVGWWGRPFGIWGQLGILWRFLVFTIIIFPIQINKGSVNSCVACTSIYTCIQLGIRSHVSFTLMSAFNIGILASLSFSASP